MLLLAGLTQYLGGVRSFFFAFLLLFQSAINTFKIISLWRLCLSVKNEITELKILPVEIQTFLSITNRLPKSTLPNAILNNKAKQISLEMSFRLQ